MWNFPCALKILFCQLPNWLCPFLTFYFMLIILALNFEPEYVKFTHNGEQIYKHCICTGNQTAHTIVIIIIIIFILFYFIWLFFIIPRTFASILCFHSIQARHSTLHPLSLFIVCLPLVNCHPHRQLLHT